jgi:ethanolamine utilization protein EutN
VILGQVVGTIWATRKHPALVARKLLLVRPYFYYNPTHEVEQIVAVDASVDAGVGDDVVVCLGAPARWSLDGINLPVDAAVLGVVDRCQLQREAITSRGLRFIGDREPRNLEWI